MNSYLIRNDELVDKETMVTIGYIYPDVETIYLDYEKQYETYPITVKEILHDHANYFVVPFDFL